MTVIRCVFTYSDPHRAFETFDSEEALAAAYPNEMYDTIATINTPVGAIMLKTITGSTRTPGVA